MKTKECCFRCSPREDDIVCRNLACPCHAKAPEKCRECQFEESHSQQCSKYVGFEVSEKCNNPERCNHKVCHPVKAPTGESWENLKKLVRKAISNGVNEYEKWHEPLAHKSSVEKRIAGFLFQSIASLLHKARLNARTEGQLNAGFDAAKVYEAGKSEAFSLVRNLLTEKISMWANTKSTALEREKATVLDVLHGLLSTLEGK